MILYRFIYCLKKHEEMPSTTCDLRKDLLIGIPIAIITLPWVLVSNIFRLTKGFSSDYGARYIILILYFLCSILGFAIGHGILEAGIVLGAYVGDVFLMGLTALALGMIFFIKYISDLVEDYWPKRKAKVYKPKKPSLIKELYTSAKEKYCKKITYI